MTHTYLAVKNRSARVRLFALPNECFVVKRTSIATVLARCLVRTIDEQDQGLYRWKECVE